MEPAQPTGSPGGGTKNQTPCIGSVTYGCAEVSGRNRLFHTSVPHTFAHLPSHAIHTPENHETRFAAVILTDCFAL